MEDKPSHAAPVESPIPRIVGGLLLVGLSAAGLWWMFHSPARQVVHLPSVLLVAAVAFGGPILAGLLRTWGAPWTRLPACVTAGFGAVAWLVFFLMLLVTLRNETFALACYALLFCSACLWQARAARNLFQSDPAKGFVVVRNTHPEFMNAVFVLFCVLTGGFLLFTPKLHDSLPFLLGVIGLYGTLVTISLMIRRIHSPGDSPAASTLRIVLAMVVIGGFLRFASATVVEDRDAFWRSWSANDLKQIGLAFHIYADSRDHFPPAAILDEEGGALFSWRYVIGYLMEVKPSAFQAEEPWNSTHNLAAAKDVGAHAYQSFPPWRYSKETDGRTCDLALIAEDGFWRTDGKGLPDERIHDFARTPIVIELPESDILWTEPRDLPVADLLSGAFSWDKTTTYPRTDDFLLLPVPRTFVLLGDGSVESLAGRPTREEIAALFSPEGEDRREAIYEHGFTDLGTDPNWPVIGVFAPWFACWVLLVGWTFVKRSDS